MIKYFIVKDDYMAIETAIHNENEQIESTKIIEPNELLNAYMSYYQLHAEQRMKILEFFITIESMLFGAAISTAERIPSVGIFAYIAVMIVSLICYLLDKRTTNLMHVSRVALRKLETSYMSVYPVKMHLFNQVKSREDKINYSRIIRLMYALVALIALVLFLMHII